LKKGKKPPPTGKKKNGTGFGKGPPSSGGVGPAQEGDSFGQEKEGGRIPKKKKRCFKSNYPTRRKPPGRRRDRGAPDPTMRPETCPTTGDERGGLHRLMGEQGGNLYKQSRRNPD